MSFRRSLLATASVAASFLFAALAARAMTISPPVFDVTADPGETVKRTIRIRNEEAFQITIRPTAANFTFKEGDETVGTPEFYPADEDPDGTAMAKWILLPAKPVVIPSGARHDLEFSIAVPEAAQPGSHFGAIHLNLVSEAAPEGPQVGIVGGAAALILMRVNGEAIESLSLAGFGSDRAAYTSLPVDFRVRLENTGTVHLRPTGNIFIRDMFGRRVAALPINPEFNSVLPGSARRFEASWSRRPVREGESEFSRQWRNFAFGRYTADFMLDDGGGGTALTGAHSFLVFPWMALLAIFGGGAGLIALFRRILRPRKL